MKNNISKTPIPTCEPVKSYKKGSAEREESKILYKKYMSKVMDIPMLINGKRTKSKRIRNIYPPHNHQHVVGKYYEGTSNHVKSAIEAALKAKKKL